MKSPLRRFGRRIEALAVDKLAIPWERRIAVRRGSRNVGRYLMVTGSAGKGTATQMAASALGAYGVARASDENNLLRGVVGTLAKLDAPVDYLVQEVASVRPGHIARASGLLPIDVAIITTIGSDHLQNYRERADLVWEKGTLVERVRPGGFAVLNADDPLVMSMASRTKESIVTYGLAPDADVRAEHIECRWPERLRFELVIGDWRRRVQTQLVSSIFVSGILAAFAVLRGFGLDPEPAVPRIEAVEARYQKLSVHASAIGHTFLLDAAKGSESATTRLLEELPNLATGPTVYIQGLLPWTEGDPSDTVIRRVLVAAAGMVDHVIGVEAACAPALALAGEPGCANVHAARGWQEALEMLRGLPPSLVIVKAGYKSKLQRIWLGAQQPVTCARVLCQRKLECIECRLLNA
jgi:UDP-N-acetylmuramoyl-tripeptide--D-alanyl-D-alanine ligase